MQSPGSVPTQEPEWVHHVRLLKRVKEVLACHDAVARVRTDRPQAIRAGIILGLILGFIVGFIVFLILDYTLVQHFKVQTGEAEFVSAVFGIPAGFVVLAVSIWMCLRGWRRELLRVERALPTTVEGFLAEFPQEVQSWGGENVLYDPDVLKELIRQQEERKVARTG
jgi:hypothetical protein